MGSFKLMRRLGKGAMGTVYLGEHAVIGSKVAVKVLHGELAQDPAALGRFHAEAKAVNLIAQENIVRIFDMGVAPPDRHYFVMEYLEGQPLTQLTGAPVSADVAVPILLQVLRALDAAHARGVVHRDLKPDNIILIQNAGDPRFVKVLDFGVAKLLGSSSQANQTGYGLCIGTPMYMAPEQWVNEGVDGRSDLYAIGGVAYLLFTGKTPFPRGSLVEMLMAHREKIPDDPRTLNPSLSPELSKVVLTALEKRPDSRFQSAAQFAEALQRAWKPDAQPEPLAPAPQAFVRGPSFPTPSPTPAPLRMREERRETSHAQVALNATLTGIDGQPMGRAILTDLSRGGAFIASENAPPALFSRLKLETGLAGQHYTVACEVVRHVSASEASAWKMSQGYAVQFIQPPPELKNAIAELLAAAHGQGQVAPKPSEVLAHYRKVPNGDVYGLLELPPQALCAEAAPAAARLRRSLQLVAQNTPSDKERAEAVLALARLESAADVIGNPTRRLEYDAAKGNFRGVARCLEAGASPVDLDRVRTAFLAKRPDNEGLANLHAISASVLRPAQPKKALVELEKALELDPLNLKYLHDYEALARAGRS